MKTNKATGPDGISPRLLAAAGTAIVVPLTNLYIRSLREAKVYDDWKVARLNPIFKKDDELDRGNYRPLSMLSVPSKILESCVTDSIVDHVFTRNQLVTEYQWAYRKGHSTDLLLAHLTETWRRALDPNFVVGVLFIDFQKAFDSISHKNLIYKLEHYYRIKGNLLAWAGDYLSKRKQYTVVNGELSDQAYVTSGVPQGSVLGPTLFALYTSDLPEAVSSASLYMYADDTTIYCIGESVDSVTNTLNNALKELEDWSSKNNLVPHPKKCEAIMLKRGSFTGPLNALALCNHTIKWVTYARLLGVTINDKLTWAQHITEVKKSFVNKLNLLKRSAFFTT